MEDLTIGQRIAAKRKELGLSQIDLGEKMGVSRQSISKWEADAAIPEIDKLIALSRLFGVSVGWLLGVEDDAQAPEAPETDFTDREWELIDRLTQEHPRIPKWLLPLASVSVCIALVALILAGAAFASARKHRQDLAAVSQAIASLASVSEALDTTILESYQFVLAPDQANGSCTFLFVGYPPGHAEGSTAELLIFADGEEVSRVSCTWDDICYRATFPLDIRNGYSAVFAVTNSSGLVRSTVVQDPALNQTLHASSFGQISVTWDSRSFQDGVLTLSEMEFLIEMPELYRDIEDPWTQCDLVVMSDGQELGRIDILNRSTYSKQVNFCRGDVDFYTPSQSIPIGDVASGTTVELLLDCRFSTDLEMQKVIGSFTITHNSK